ncbi:MAG: F0F1 ATP synthase subunit gamma, partial [Nitrospinota bacterium]
MASLRQIKRRIGSVKSTQQITRAMKLVAAAKLRRSQERLVAARPFADKLREVIQSLTRRAERLEH